MKKSPDKIYLNIPKAGTYDDATWDTTEFDDCINEVYVRRDAIIEWAKEKKSKTVLEDDFWQKVIDKLESM